MPVPALNRKALRLGGWTELAALGTGAFLAWLSLVEPRTGSGPQQFTAPILLGAGLLLMGWGLRKVGGALWSWMEGWVWQGGRRYRVHFHREALVYIAMLLVLCLGALIGASNMLMLVFGLMVGPFVLGGQVTRLILNRLQVSRILPDYAVAGQNLMVRLELTNRKSLFSAWMVTATDRFVGIAEEQHPAVLFARVPPHSHREAGYSVRPAHRGMIRFGPVRVACNFPLGLMERSFELGQAQQLLVLPRIGRLTHQWHVRERDGANTAELAHARLGLFDDEFDRLREYRGGDNTRAIHWRTTARRNELMVREYQHHRWPGLLLAVDLWQPARPGADDLLRVELAISLAATMCVESARSAEEAPIWLVICGRTTATLAGDGHAGALQGLMEALAVAQANPVPDLSAAWSTGALQDPSCRRLLVTTRSSYESVHASMQERAAETGEETPDFDIVRADPAIVSQYLEFDDLPQTVTQ